MSRSHPETEEELQGDFGIWLVIYVELFTFFVIFTGYSIARVNNVELFNASQLMLDKNAGVINTLLLITASWFVMRSVENIKEVYETIDSKKVSQYLMAAIGLGVLFVISKISELIHVFSQGIDLSTNTFFTFYILLAIFHLMHVLLGIFVLVILTLRTKEGKYTKENHIGLESGALYWHLVDLLWIVLFMLVYIMR